VGADRKREEEERRLKRAIEEILLEHPEYGYRRVTEELHVSTGRESPSTTSGSTACFRTSTSP
jgi:hypothetical protein